jgi:POT family proton-dependent oligopeptide transporter
LTVSDTGTCPAGEDIADPSGWRGPRTSDTAFFGHPKGLGYLTGSELWERFSFYGMQALLMLYMTKHLLTPGNADKVLGLATYRGVLEGAFGPMTDLALAAQTFGLYSGLILVTPLIGAWLGDRVLGRTKTISIGALLMAAGHLVMASERLFLLALLLLILGGGGFIGNLQAQIGSLYAPEDNRRTRAFGVYLIALNIGALASPLIVGTLGEQVGWHWGFTAAGIGMIVGLLVYLSGLRHLPPDVIASRSESAPRLTREQWITVGALLLTFLPRILANASAQQAYGLMLVWAEQAVDRSLFGWEVPVSWVMTADGIMTILGVLIAARLWIMLGRRGREPSDLNKVAIGNLLLAIAFAFVALLAGMPSVPIAAWLVFYLILDLSFAWWDPPARALISRHAPPAIVGTMFALSNLASALGFFALGFFGRYYEPLGAQLYFLLTALLPLVAAVGMFAGGGAINRLLERGTERATPAEDAGSPQPA